jgi:hypothetical protein
MRLAAFQQFDGEGHGFLDEPLITGKHARPGPHQAKPGFGSHRRRFEIALLDPDCGPSRTPPVPAARHTPHPTTARTGTGSRWLS